MKDYSTKELVEELRRRQGVESVWIEPEWQYEVAVQTDEPHPNGYEWGRYLEGGIHRGDNKGPAWILVVTD
jgi:hypothetical protein